MKESEKGPFNKEFLDRWYNNYHKLEAFCRHKANAGEPDEELARWMGIQRSIRHMLPVELKNKLAALNFNFEEKETSWEHRYGQLVRFVEKTGHACLPDDQKHEALKDWLMRQIQSKKLLSKSQFQSLDRLGVDWEVALSRDQRWELMFRRLQAFYAAFGHCRVPQRWAKDRQLALWVTVQRRMYAQNKLREDRQRQLCEVSFVWDMQTQYDAQWEQHFQELVAFRNAHGHFRVPGKHQKLVGWIERQRTAKAKNLLSAERVEQLNRIGFIWSFEKIKKKNWEAMYQQLCTYRQKHGHSFVPVNCRENKSLGIWVGSQRWLEAQGKLGAVKKRKLSEIGFVWSRDTQDQLKSVYDAQWEASFQKLKRYSQVHGTCQVSLKIDPVLQRWTRWQRKLFYEGRLSVERIDRLNEIRFPWSVQEGYWMRMYDALVEFSRQFGHTRVPCGWGPNPRLAAWVYRTRRDKEGLTNQKVELLNGIGFNWGLSRKTVVEWSDMYGRLLKFKEQHGHTRVPLKWREDLKLGKWVSRMRQERKKLTPERRTLLDTIAFNWSGRKSTEKPAEICQNQTFVLNPA